MKEIKEESRLGDLRESTLLVLEGGAMRGVFTAGVLDYFMKRKCFFKNTIGISAGVLQGLCYVSHQMGRNLKVNSKYAPDKRYMGFSNLLKTGSYFNFRFIFGELAHQLEPFDYVAFENSEEIITAVVTNCHTGEPLFVNNKEEGQDKFMKICEASCSIPLVSKPIQIGKHFYCDGGVGMPLVPLPEEIPLPYKKIVYVLTRDKDYRKKSVPKFLRKVLDMVYGKIFPHIVEGMCTIPERYNGRVEKLEALEKEGKVFVIRPQKPVDVSRIEKDSKKLRLLHREGYTICEERFEEMMRWLHEE